MAFLKIFAPLFAIVFSAAVNATAVASPEANALVEVEKRGTPGNVYVCPQTNWGGDCAVISAANWCNPMTGWEYDTQSIGPDDGATCYGYSNTDCTGTQWTFTYPGDGTGGWATANPWGLAIGSMYCAVGGGGGGGGGGSGVSGLATYYYPEGGYGACGWTIQNWDMAVAIGSGNWNGGSHCGATMTVTYGSTTIQVTVADLCPGCQGANGIDLTQGAMAAMDPNWYNNGVDSVTWSVSY
ncbi:hypothetical protein MSAN_01130900 [Mycena sanguinolenta]|uniref:RlpA-like double-psi beta-barrel-protein domain-containing protein-containing protein n=1 Tax=Mycena sanguinolenta TaxID=230812 RepID=A0A8H6YL12_9AGAR|nr:hypothetical protein MSAN_01130900 [Mycena sanguinolenta]